MDMNLYFAGFYFFAFVFGAIIGSFLNVVILRRGAHIQKKRSFCFSCGRTLKPLDLIPIASFVFLGGKCRQCKSKISAQYFWVELSFAVLSCIILFISKDFNIYIWSAKYVLLMVMFAFFLCTFVYDLKHKIMPDDWTVGALASAIIYSVFFGVGFKLAVLGGLLVGIPLALIYFLSRGRAMGFGDVKFAPIMGVLLGASGGFSAMMIAFWVGGVLGIYLLIKYPKKINRKSEIPFGPFLIIGTTFAFIFNLNLDILLTCFQRILS